MIKFSDVNSCWSDLARLLFRVELTNELTPKFAHSYFAERQEINYGSSTKRTDHCITKLPAMFVVFNWTIYFAAESKLSNTANSPCYTRHLFNIYHLMIFDQ